MKRERVREPDIKSNNMSLVCINVIIMTLKSPEVSMQCPMDITLLKVANLFCLCMPIVSNFQLYLWLNLHNEVHPGVIVI